MKKSDWTYEQAEKAVQECINSGLHLRNCCLTRAEKANDAFQFLMHKLKAHTEVLKQLGVEEMTYKVTDAERKQQ